MFVNMRLVNRYLIIVIIICIGSAVFIKSIFYKQRPTLKFLGKIPMRSNDSKIFTKLRSNITCLSKVRLLILVSSKLEHFDRRTLIRNTWGKDSFPLRWRTVFLLTNNGKERDQILGQKEEGEHGDVIFGEYNEAFVNMAFKVAMGFEWALKFCKFDFLLKADDDVFVNTFNLLEYLNRKSTPKRSLYTGNPMKRSVVLRDGRYAVKYQDSGEKRDDQLNKTMFAPYCSGGGFLLSVDVVSTLFNLYDLEHPLNIDDAYIGELAKRANIELLFNDKNFLMYADDCKYRKEAFVQHPAKGKCLESLYRQYISYLMDDQTKSRKIVVVVVIVVIYIYFHIIFFKYYNI